MEKALLWFWTAMIFLSIAWYGLLLLYVGLRGGGEIVQMTRNLTARHDEETE